MAPPLPQSRPKATSSTGDVTNIGKERGSCVMVVVLRQKWPLWCSLPGCMGCNSSHCTLGKSLSASWREAHVCKVKILMNMHLNFSQWVILATVLTPSWPLESCRLTVCSNCCSSLTVWFSPAVSFSFLSISSCLTKRQTVYFVPKLKTQKQMLLTKTWLGLSPSVMSGCCSLSAHHYCLSLWRAPREWGQATAGPALKS